jgi:hypothetical protein
MNVFQQSKKKVKYTKITKGGERGKQENWEEFK